jgi:hypothetical protein
MKTHMLRWLARVTLSLVAIAAWGTGATAQSLSGVYGGPKCPYMLTFRGKGVVYMHIIGMAEVPGQYKVDGDKVPVTAGIYSTVFTRKGHALSSLFQGQTAVCTELTKAAAAAMEQAEQDRPLLASMRSDLRNLVTAEEAYFADHGKYTANLKAIPGGFEEGQPFSVTPGNSMPGITLVGGGWMATIQNPNTRQVCAVFVGTKTPIPPATEEGSPKCA